MATFTPRTRVRFVDDSPAFPGQFGTIVRISGVHPTYGDPVTVILRMDDGTVTTSVRVDNLDALPTVHTNHIPRNVIDAHELSADERARFDYLNWDAIDAGEDSASFFRYRGDVHDLGEFTVDYGITRGAGLPDHMRGWDAFRSDSFFDGLVIRFVDDGERVIVGHVY
jgi:hypothetical protein